MKYSDGTLTLHQSDIGHYMTCPEQFRVTNRMEPGVILLDEPGIRVESDAATLGTVFHSVVEYDITGGAFKTLNAARSFARTEMAAKMTEYIQSGVEYRAESFGDDPTKILGELDKLVATWFASSERDYWLMLMSEHRSQVLVEHFMDVPFITGRDGIIQNVRLAGTPDIVDIYNNRVVDWKTAGRTYQRWEKQRWAVQPTVYTFMAAHEGHIRPTENGYVFEYRVMVRGKNGDEPQPVLVHRTEAQWSWLLQLVTNMVTMWESNAPQWPLRDDHALCGPKWCPLWYSCKGQFVNEDWS